MPFLKREGRTRIYYETHGKGVPLLLSHGFSSNSSMWSEQIEPLVGAGYQVIVWDFRGHGRSSYPDAQYLYSEALTVEDMLALLEKAAGSKSAVVGGLSLGGYMGLAFYKQYPSRVRALLIIDTGPGYRSHAAREAWNRSAHKQASRFDKEGLETLQQMSPERSKVTHRNADGLAMAARGMLTQRDSSVMDVLSRIAVPAAVVVGADDQPFLGATEYMHKKIPVSKKIVIPNAGHASNIDQPAMFNEGILGFLRATQAAPRAKL